MGKNVMWMASHKGWVMSVREDSDRWAWRVSSPDGRSRSGTRDTKSAAKNASLGALAEMRDGASDSLS